MQKGNSGSAPLQGSALKVFNAPQNLLALMAKRGSKHPVAGQEQSLEIVCREGDGCCIL